ncbi:MAG: methionyl-tRNA formyltransferase [bacterium]|nr:methionyl-tRNA formyltransferase [bacterium]
MKIKFAFFGTDNFAVTILHELKKAGLLPALVVTMPDRPKGRGLKLSSPPAKEWAVANNVPFLQPDSLDSFVKSELLKVNSGVFAVASYGKIIPAETLAIPSHGTLNVHPSLLPKYRGPTPIESQILEGEEHIGVTIMLVDEKMDHGPLLAQREVSISNSQLPKKTSELEKELAKMGGELLAETMPKWVAGEIHATPQDEAQATVTKKFSKQDAEINLLGNAEMNFRKIQALEQLNPYFFVSSSSPFQRGGAEGGGVKKTRVIIKDTALKDGVLTLIRVIPEGGVEMSYDEFLRGFRGR